MQEKLLNLQEAALNEIKATSNIEAVESLRVKYLGKKGEITAILKEMGKLSAEERPVIGKRIYRRKYIFKERRIKSYRKAKEIS